MKGAGPTPGQSLLQHIQLTCGLLDALSSRRPGGELWRGVREACGTLFAHDKLRLGSHQKTRRGYRS